MGTMRSRIKPKSVIIHRRAEISDIPTLVNMRIRFLSEHQGRLRNIRLRELKRNLFKYFRRTLASDEFIAWLAFEGARAVATSGLCFYCLPPTAKNPSGRIAYIMNMYTLPRYRKKGIAKQLFAKILQEARMRGHRKIVLHASRDGEHLYRACGFEEPSDLELERCDQRPTTGTSKE